MPRIYAFTQVGEQIAEDSGLRVLTDRLIESEKADPLTYKLANIYGGPEDLYDDEELVEYVGLAWHGLRTEAEKREFARGINVEGSSSWRYVGDEPADTLFAAPNAEFFTAPKLQDNIALSGVVGLQYLKYRRGCQLFSRSGFGKFGFDNFVSATAFAGAYILGRVTKDKEEYWRIKGMPTFEFVHNNVHHQVEVGADMHGDFRMFDEAELAAQSILAPTNQFVEFSPSVSILVGGYHSVEPALCSAMLESELIHEGEGALTTLLGRFTGVLRGLADDNGNLYGQMGNFGDFGDGSVDSQLGTIEELLSDTVYLQRKTAKQGLYSLTYAPGSGSRLEVLHAGDGITLRNRNPETNIGGGSIFVPREAFPDFFRALVVQTQRGLGRTSPGQIVELITGVHRLLGAHLG